MADPSEVHFRLNRLEIFLNGASAAAVGPIGKPAVRIGTTGGEIKGEWVGYSVVPPAGEQVGTAKNHSDAMLHIVTDKFGGETVHVLLSQVSFIAFAN